MCPETSKSLTYYREEILKTLLGDRHDQPIEEMPRTGLVTETDTGGFPAHGHTGTHTSVLLSGPRTRANKKPVESDLQPYFLPQLFVCNRACGFLTFKGIER